MNIFDRLPRAAAWGVVALMLAGGVLRVAAATGGMWLDEAWSVYFANDVAPFIGVLSSINHDNNHHINSWWLQLVGMSAPPLVMRALSIVTGTLAIGVAALILARRGALPALVGALLFAISPIMVVYGAEARGYAPFILALLATILVTQNWLEGADDAAPPRDALALLAAAGMLSHLLMAPALATIAAWILLDRGLRLGWRRALPATIDALVPTAIVAISILVIILLTARLVAGGMGMGGYDAFQWDKYAIAIEHLAGLTTGIGRFGWFDGASFACAAASLAGLAVIGRFARARLAFYLPFVLLVPVAVLILQPGNSGFARYYLVSSVGMLLMAAEALATATVREHSRPAMLAAGAIVAAWSVGSLLQYRTILDNQRGHPEDIIAALKRLSPGGATVRLGHMRAEATFAVLSAQTGYPVKIVGAGCGDWRFWFSDHYGFEALPATMDACGVRWRAAAHREYIGPSGQSWTLYERQGLPSRVAAVNGPHPAR